MSLLNTKPRWYKGEVIATERGWVNEKTGEVLVAIGNLKAKLEAEGVVEEIKPVVVVENVAPKVEIPTVEEVKPEVKKEELKMEPVIVKKPRKPYTYKVVGEVTEKKIPQGQQLIGEVVEYNLDTPVIGE